MSDALEDGSAVMTRTSTVGSFESLEPVWEDNTSNCQICSAELGKRKLAPRHHCRICGRCVCQTCSPNSLRFAQHKSMQRVCTQCGDNAINAPTFSSTLGTFTERMRLLQKSGRRPGQNDVDAESATADGSIVKRRKSQIEALLSPRDALHSPRASANQRISEPLRHRIGTEVAPSPWNLEDAVVACENELGLLEGHNAEANLNNEIRTAFTRDIEARASQAEEALAKLQQDKTNSSSRRGDTVSKHSLQQAQEDANRSKSEAMREKDVRRQLETRVEAARVASLRLGQRIRGLSGTPKAAKPEAANLEEAVALSAAALAPLEAAYRRQDGQSPKAADKFYLGSGDDIETASTTVGSMSSSLPIGSSCSTLGGQQLLNEGASTSDLSHTVSDAEQASQRRSRCRKRFLLASLLSILLVSCFGFVTWFWILPAIVQTSVLATRLTLVSATMSQPTEDSVKLLAVVQTEYSGLLGAQLEPFRMTLSDSGKAFGWLDFPALTLDNGVAEFRLEADLHVMDAVALGAATSRALLGQAAQWELQGSTYATLFGHAPPTVQVKMPDTLHIPLTPAGLRQDGEVKLKLLSAEAAQDNVSADQLVFTADAMRLSSASVLQIRDFGRLEVHVAKGGVSIGRVVFGNLHLGSDAAVQTNVSLILNTGSHDGGVATFLGDWLSGTRQTVSLAAGGSSNAFINGFELAFDGLPGGVLGSAFATKEQSIVGHVDSTGAECSLMTDRECMRGSGVTARGFAEHGVTVTDISLDVNLQQDLIYNVLMKGPAVGSLYSAWCNKGSMLTQLTSAAGMWSHLDPSRAKDASVSLPGISADQPSLTSFFLAAQPQSGQTDGSQCFSGLFKHLSPYDCCFNTLLPAAACFFKAKQSNFIPANVRGNITFIVDGVRVRVPIEQDEFPITFAEDMAGVQSAPVSFACDAFTFDYGANAQSLAFL